MNNENLNKKNYSKLSYQFMAFGSAMNALQGQIKKEDIRPVFEEVKNIVSDYVDELYKSEQPDEPEQKVF